MRVSRSLSCLAAVIGVSGVFAPLLLSAPTSAPGGMDSSAANASADDRPPVQSSKELINAVNLDGRIVVDLSGRNDERFKTYTDRVAIAPQLIPAIQKMRRDMNKLVDHEPEYDSRVQGEQVRLLAKLSVLGDKESTSSIDLMVASPDPVKSIQGQAAVLMKRWIVSDRCVSDQTPLIDDLEKLDRDHPESVSLTVLTLELSREAASADLNRRMLTIASDEMNNPAAASIKKKLAVKQTAAAATAAAEDKPLTIAGMTPEGKPFTTSDLKGKVVLVDFWATWCGPCRAELPRVKILYSTYHDKGLEVLGVSNDFDVQTLNSFVVKEQMPWPELLDTKAAADQQPNPITLAQGITAIPAMYLIDKKGILRSVDARDNMEELIPKLLAEAD